MNRKTRSWGSLILSVVLAASLLPSAALAGDTDPAADVVHLSGDWQGSVFGDVGGQNKITADNFDVSEQSDGTVTLRASNNKGKISSKSEGIAYYFKELPADANFTLTAKATVKAFDENDQVSFGIMLRDRVLSNTNSKDRIGDYLAVGPIKTAKSAGNFVFYRTMKDSTAYAGDLSEGGKPVPGATYPISLKKSGDVYRLAFGSEEPVTMTFDALEGDKLFAGLFVSRNATVDFRDVQLQTDTLAVDSLKVDASGMKRDYLLGQKLDTTGLEVTAVSPDGSRTRLSPDDYLITGFDSSAPGQDTITVNDGGASAPIDLTIYPLTMTSLDVVYYPAKTEYYLGDSFDPAGMEVKAVYNDGYRTAELSSDQYAVSINGDEATGDAPHVFKEWGLQWVTVTSKENPQVAASFDIMVHGTSLKGIEIKRPPKKTVYYTGDELDLAGLAVYADYSTGAQVRLAKDEYQVSPLDTAATGEQQLTVTFRGKTAELPVTVKQRALTGIAVTGYPRTTYATGEKFDSAGLVVSKVYDNGDREELKAADYRIDLSKFDSGKPGVASIGIVPNEADLAPISLPATIQDRKPVEWSTIVFGQSTKGGDKNFVKKTNDGAIEIASLDGAGKVATDHDGISYYYTVLDASKDNFILSADIQVLDYAKSPHDGQEAFGIMARDAIGADGDSSVFASNIAGVGGFSGGSSAPNGTQLFVRTGVRSPDGSGSNGLDSRMLQEGKPDKDNTYPAQSYHLTLAKTNSGFTGQLNDGKKAVYYTPDLLGVQNGKLYVGFFTARLAHIEVRNIRLQVSAAETDAPKVVPPAPPVEPELQILSIDKTSSTDYLLQLQANVDGIATVNQDRRTIATDIAVKAGEVVTVPAALQSNQMNIFNVTFLPDDTQKLTSDSRVIRHLTVTMKTFGNGGDIYVSPTGTPDGTGGKDHPLDLDTAVAYVLPGQRVVMLDGVYKRDSALVIPKADSGTADAMKELAADAGARPVLDFRMKSEGVVLSGDYWHVQGIDVTNSGGNLKGMTVGGNHNIVENCRFYENGDTGLQISRTNASDDIRDWPSYNLILNNESFDNHDPSENNADGFAAKLTAGVGNVFRGDISHNNADDGWDLYTKAGTGAIGPVTIEDCITYGNGTLTDGTETKGDGNGFKLGGEGINVHHLIKNSLAFNNRAVGFASNSNPGVYAENDVAFNNGKANISFTTYGNIQEDFRIDGFVSYRTEGKAVDDYPARLASDRNYFFDGTESSNQSGDVLTDRDFAGLAPTLPFQRDEDGNILRGDFMKRVTP